MKAHSTEWGHKYRFKRVDQLTWSMCRVHMIQQDNEQHEDPQLPPPGTCYLYDRAPTRPQLKAQGGARQQAGA